LVTEDFDIPEFPKTHSRKAKTIREHFNMTVDEFAPLVHANNGAEIESYERDFDLEVATGTTCNAKAGTRTQAVFPIYRFS